ncbi:sugar ABC transporter permease [Candidatus Nomurabacteria bacterium]|nr:sugar ABC transporter permease [Candidatus Nomurabacteria bacterium]
MHTDLSADNWSGKMKQKLHRSVLRLKQIPRYKISYLFITPYMLIFFLFSVLPVLFSLVISFTSFNMLEPPKFTGTENYVRMFLGDDIFLVALKNTFLLAVITGPVGYILSFGFAWMINELKPKLRAFVTLVFYAPSISGNVFMIWAIAFSGDSYGYVNGIMLKLGLIQEPILFFMDPKYIMNLIIAVSLWVSLGTSFLAFIAGLQGIDKTYYEAGAVDGIKNRWQELWFITLPSMKPQLMFGAVMSITASFGIGNIVTVLAGFPSTDYAAHTLVNHLEDYGGLRFEMGYASAIATFLFFIMITTNIVIKKLISKVGQ